MPIPISKFIAVAIRQAAKPVATYMQKKAETYPVFRGLCINFARLYHLHEYRLIQNFYGRTPRSTSFPHLNEQKAIELGTTLFGEAIIFSIAAILLAAEYQRGTAKEIAKERMIWDQIYDIKREIDGIKAVIITSLKKP